MSAGLQLHSGGEKERVVCQCVSEIKRLALLLLMGDDQW